MMKKSLEIAISTAVLLIISLLTFILAISFVYKIYYGAETMQANIDQQTQAEIERIMRTTNQAVSIPFSTKQAKPGNWVTFGIGIRNLANEPAQYTLVTQFESAITPDGTEAIPLSRNVEEETNAWLGTFEQITLPEIKPREHQTNPITLKVPTNSQKGYYFFNVCVFPQDITPYDCDSSTNIDDIYGGQIQRLTIEVV